MRKFMLCGGVWVLFLAGYSGLAQNQPEFDAAKIQPLLIKADGTKAAGTALTGKKYILLYFSAHWCPPCRAFTPKLIQFYKANNKGQFEVIFVSADKDAAGMKTYMHETAMPWPAVKYEAINQSQLRSYSGRGIPCLVLINPKGEVLADSYAGEKYLGPEKVLNDLKKMLEQEKPNKTGATPKSQSGYPGKDKSGAATSGK